MLSKGDFSGKYLELITGPYRGINLTRILNQAEFEVKQYEDSCLPFINGLVEITSENNIVDIGFGGGFPILPLSNHFRSLQFYGIETRNKKVKAVTDIAQELGLSNVELMHGRYENYIFKRNSLVVFKAVDSMSNILKKIHAEKDVRVCFYKGANFFELEGKELETIKDNWSIITNEKYTLSSGDQRHFLVAISKGVPRGTRKTDLLTVDG